MVSIAAFHPGLISGRLQTSDHIHEKFCAYLFFSDMNCQKNKGLVATVSFVARTHLARPDISAHSQCAHSNSLVVALRRILIRKVAEVS
jgi:hypothetical protein